MGCNSYEVGSQSVSTTYDSDEYPCLCTMSGDGSHNGEALSARDIRSMAALGAAVVLARNGYLTSGYIVTPAHLPDRLKAAIEYFIPVGTTEEATQ